MSLTERLTATLRPLVPHFGMLSRRGVRIYLAPTMVVAAAMEGDRLAGAAALPVANPGGHWEAPLAALRALLRHPAETLADTLGEPLAGNLAANLAETPAEIPAKTTAKTTAKTPAEIPSRQRPQPRMTGAAAPTPAGAGPAILAASVAQAGHTGNTGNTAAGTAAVLAALDAQAPLSVSLSGRWCQSVMAPWSDALLAEPAATRFLQMQLAAVYGDAARGWSIANDDAPYGQPRAACGIDAELLQALRTELGKRCGAIEPILGTAARMPTGLPAFAIVEAGKLTMAATAHGRIAALCSQPCGPAWPAELERAWRRWMLRMPELDGVSAVAVIDLSGQASPPQALPAPFQAVATPFGPAPALVQSLAPATPQEALCA